jgi:hypothetical protein
MLLLPIFAVAAATIPCPWYVSAHSPAQIGGEPAICAQYASVSLGGDSAVVVYAIQPAGEDLDLPHRVFVARTSDRDGHPTVVARQEVTSRLLDAGERGSFHSMRVAATPFVLRRQEFVDVAVESTISGSGAITGMSDLIFEVGRGDLRLAVVLKNSGGWARGGVSYMAETTSEVFAGATELIWVRKARVARRSHSDEAFTIHCAITRTAYVLNGRSLLRRGEVDASLLRKRRADLHQIPRIERAEFLPCCAGCRRFEP